MKLLSSVVAFMVVAIPAWAKDAPESIEACDYYNDGTACQAKNDLDGALTNYRKALSIESFGKVYYAMGTVYCAKGDYEKEIAAYKSAHKVAPEIEQYRDIVSDSMQYRKFQKLVDQAIARQKSGNEKEAIRIYERALQLNPESASAWMDLGSAYQQVNNFQKAGDCYERAVQIDPKGQPDLFYWLAVLDEYANNGTKAIEHYKKYLEANRDNAARSQAAKDRVQALSADPGAVMKYMNAEETQQCDQAQSFWVAAIKLQTEKRYEEAIANYDKALALVPNEPAYYYAKGSAYQAKGDLDQALKNYETAAQFNHSPAYKDAVKQARAQIASKIIDRAIDKQNNGDIEGAVADYRTAMAICDEKVVHILCRVCDYAGFPVHSDFENPGRRARKQCFTRAKIRVVSVHNQRPSKNDRSESLGLNRPFFVFNGVIAVRTRSFMAKSASTYMWVVVGLS